ncbi:MAG: hypothetical protein ACLFTE_05130 [Salinivenus sp.]
MPESLTVEQDQMAIPPPLEIAIVNKEGDCAGTGTWTGEGSTLTVWGRADSSEMPSSAASGPLAPGDSLRLRLFDPTSPSDQQPVRSAAMVFRSGPDHLETRPFYVPNGIYVVDTIEVASFFTSDHTPRP